MEFFLLDCGQLDCWRGATFGYIFLVRVLHFLPRVQLFLETARQLLVPAGGLVVVNFPLFSLDFPAGKEVTGPEGHSGRVAKHQLDKPWRGDNNTSNSLVILFMVFMSAVSKIFEDFYSSCFSAQLVDYWSPAVQEEIL